MPIGYVYMLKENNIKYIGSTTKNPSQRLSGHKIDKSCMSRELDLKNAELIILEEVDYIDKTDTLLIQEEQKWIEMTPDCINKHAAYVPDEIKHDRQIEICAMSQEKHREKINRNAAIKAAIRVKCEKCGKELRLGNLSRHNTSFHK